MSSREFVVRFSGARGRVFVVIDQLLSAVICRLGRQRVIWFTSTGQFAFGIAVAFTFDYYSFVIVRFLLAMVRKDLHLGSFYMSFPTPPQEKKSPFCYYFLP